MEINQQEWTMPHLQSKELKIRKTNLFYDQMKKERLVSPYNFPAESELSYEKYIVGFVHAPGWWHGMNVIMSDGTRSTLKQESCSSEKWREVKIATNQQVRSIVVFGDDIEFGGV